MRSVARVRASWISIFHLALFSNALREKLALCLHFRVFQCPPTREAGSRNTFRKVKLEVSVFKQKSLGFGERLL